MTRRPYSFAVAVLGSLVLAAACTSVAPTASPSPSPTAAPSPSPTVAPVVTPTASPTAAPTGPVTLDAPDEISAGLPFQVTWTGPDAEGDFITLVAAGAERWTNEQYFYTTEGSPGDLVAPTTTGDYELWYVKGADDSVTARRPITVTDFVGTLSAADSVTAGTIFEVEWTGPNAPGDYVTIVAEGTERWSNEDYFYTTEGTPAELIAPVKTGSYELWYVTGTDAIMLRRPIAVTAFTVTLDAPDSVDGGAQFEVSWTGPDGPQDYITIVAAGSAPGTYGSYAYTSTGNPVTLTAPETAGPYEIRYQSDREDGVFGSIPIVVN